MANSSFSWFRHEESNNESPMVTTTMAMLREGVQKMPAPKKLEKSIKAFGAKAQHGIFHNGPNTPRMITTYDRFFNRAHVQNLFLITKKYETDAHKNQTDSCLNRLPMNNFLPTHIETKFIDDFFWHRPEQRKRVDCHRQRRRQSTCFPNFDEKKYFVDEGDEIHYRNTRYNDVKQPIGQITPSLDYTFTKMLNETENRMEQINSIAWNGRGSVPMQRDDDYRVRMMKMCNTPADEDINDKASTCGKLLICLSVVLVMLTLPFSLFVCFKVVQEYERAVIFRLGRLMQGGAKGPGIFFILPCIDSYARVDLRTRTYDVPPQEVLTKDSVTVSVDAVVYYRVSNATVSIANVENAHHSTRLLAQTTLRNTMGTRHLHEILSERETISGTMQVQLDEATDAWGIKVERVEIKDVRLPVQLQRAMAAEAEAAREARAKVIAAEGEQKASKALREASEVIGDSPAALQLRYLQTLNSISAEKNSTIVFPLPIDLITYFLKTNDKQTIQNSAIALAKMASPVLQPSPLIAQTAIPTIQPLPQAQIQSSSQQHQQTSHHQQQQYLLQQQKQQQIPQQIQQQHPLQAQQDAQGLYLPQYPQQTTAM